MLERMVLLVEIRLGDFEESAVTDCLDGKDKGLPCEYSELAHHLSSVGHKQADSFLFAYHSLVGMKTTRQNKV